MIGNGMRRPTVEPECNFVDHPGDIERCKVCEEDVSISDPDTIRLYTGYIHEDCLEDYCDNEGSTSDYATEFVKEHFEDFMKFVRRTP